MEMAAHFTHLALMVMVIDLCFNRGETDVAERKAEVKAGLQMFEIPETTLRFVMDSLTGCVRFCMSTKLTDSSASTTNRVVSFVHETKSDAFILPHTDRMQSTQLGLQLQDPGVALDTSFDTSFDASFDEFWQTALQSEPNLNPLTWDNMFSAVDSRPI
jgi:hypothetical protein